MSFSKFRKQDPAPSRLRYKFSRWMLSPVFKKTLLYGVPLIILTLPSLVLINDQKNKEQVQEIAFDLYRKLIERPEFMINALSIEGASDSLNSEIREVLGLRFPISSFDLDLADLHKRILSLPPVETAEAHIKGGGILHLRVGEKAPALLLRKEYGFAVLNEYGQYIRSVPSREHIFDLPVIAGEGAESAAPQAMNIFKTINKKFDHIRGLVFVGQRRWNIIMKTGQVVMLPENDPAKAVQKILILDQAEQILSRDIAVFDFRLSSRITLRLPLDEHFEIDTKVVGVKN